VTDFGPGDDDDPHVVIQSSTIPAITLVRVYASTLEHARERHGHEFGQIIAGLPVMSEALAAAYTNPTHIENPRPGAYVFVDASSTNYAGDPLRAPVKLISGTSALAKTFYFASTTGERNIVWRRTS